LRYKWWADLTQPHPQPYKGNANLIVNTNPNPKPNTIPAAIVNTGRHLA